MLRNIKCFTKYTKNVLIFKRILAHSHIQNIVYIITFLMIINLITIGIGGFLGAISRYLVFMIDDKFYHHTEFPLGTFAVNIFGSLLIGIALGLSIKYDILSRGSFSHYLFVTGFLGAFTTFSTFSQDSFQLLIEKHYWFFISNIFMNVVIGIFVVALGYLLITKKI